MAEDDTIVCEKCGAEWVKGKDHPPGIRGVTRPCPRAESTRPRTQAELDVEEYQTARIACELARNFLKQHDFKKLLVAIRRADSVGHMIDPTLYRDKYKVMLEDKAVFEAAQRFLQAWEKVDGR